MAFQLAWRIRIVMLMVPVWPESDFLGRAARASHSLRGLEQLQRHEHGINAVNGPAATYHTAQQPPRKAAVPRADRARSNLGYTAMPDGEVIPAGRVRGVSLRHTPLCWSEALLSHCDYQCEGD
jgi:hypothetical protein